MNFVLLHKASYLWMMLSGHLNTDLLCSVCAFFPTVSLCSSITGPLTCYNNCKVLGWHHHRCIHKHSHHPRFVLVDIVYHCKNSFRL